MAVCHAEGCDVELPTWPVSRVERKWCSERCRKSQYAGPCADYGAPTSGSDGRGPRASTHCKACAPAHYTTSPGVAARAAAKRRRIFELWNQGANTTAIAEALRTTPGTISVDVTKMRAAGWDLPHRQGPRRANQ